jgi:ADP-heptose:LPS heptosyltransferase
LQKEVRERDIAVLKAHPEIIDHAADLVDFTDTAALIAELDVVISVDTAVTHLAGALGKLIWVMLPFHPDFRWLRGREDSPWYPTARLFGQQSDGKWDSVVERIGREAAELGTTR